MVAVFYMLKIKIFLKYFSLLLAFVGIFVSCSEPLPQAEPLKPVENNLPNTPPDIPKKVLTFDEKVEASKNNPIDLGEISDAQFIQLFGLNPEQLKSSVPIGRGAEGTVYSVTCFKDKECALKQNSSQYEFDYLSENQDTEAVIKIYFMFSLAGKTYLLMDKGEQIVSYTESTLAYPLADTINEDGLLESAKAFINLLKKSSGSNNDIKPNNTVWSKGRLRLIDPSGLTTPTYTGSQGNRLARIILEQKIKNSLVGGAREMGEYRALQNDRAMAMRIASPTYIVYWNRFICEHYKLAKNCDNVVKFDDLFSLVVKNKELIIQLLEKNSNEYMSPAHIKYYKYDNEDSQLQNPILYNIHDLDPYFAKRKDIGQHFCGAKYINDEYKERVCKSSKADKGGGFPIFTFDETIAGKNASDHKFKEFIFNVYWYITRDYIIDYLLGDKKLSNLHRLTYFIIIKETKSALMKTLVELNNL